MSVLLEELKALVASADEEAEKEGTLVRIADEQVVQALQESIRTAIAASFTLGFDLTEEYSASGLVDAVRYADHANKVIAYWSVGGEGQVDIVEEIIKYAKEAEKIE